MFLSHRLSTLPTFRTSQGEGRCLTCTATLAIMVLTSLGQV